MILKGKSPNENNMEGIKNMKTSTKIDINNIEMFSNKKMNLEIWLEDERLSLNIHNEIKRLIAVMRNSDILDHFCNFINIAILLICVFIFIILILGLVSMKQTEFFGLNISKLVLTTKYQILILTVSIIEFAAGCINSKISTYADKRYESLKDAIVIELQENMEDKKIETD